MGRAEEIRLRVGRSLSLTMPEGIVPLVHTAVLREDLQSVLERATECSPYAAEESLRQGYLTAAGGFRIGVCGTAVMEGGLCRGMRDVSSLVIRIPSACTGLADRILPQLITEGRLRSTLILSPPGGGKTTLLRDLVRLLGDGSAVLPPLRVGLADERGEITAMYRGVAQLNVGANTDVLAACAKAEAVEMLLRSMSLQVIALDEIGGERDISAVRAAANCGVAVIATAHAADTKELRQKPSMKDLAGVFSRAVIIEGSGCDRTYRTEEL